MHFYNDCCRARFAAAVDPNTADRIECICGQTHMWDGAKWLNVLELGQRKVDKLRVLGRVHLLTRGME